MFAILRINMLLAFLLAALTNAVQLSDALQHNVSGETFELHGRVISEPFSSFQNFAVEDPSGAVIILPSARLAPPHVGDRVHVHGTIEMAEFGHAAAKCTHIEVLAPGPTPPIPTASFREILAGEFDARVIRICGMLRDYFLDEIDPKYLFLILNQDGETIYAITTRPSSNDLKRIEAQIGQPLTIVGLCDPRSSGCRRKIGRLLRINDLATAISAPTAATDTFSIPLFSKNAHIQPAALSSLGRQRVRGRVIAVWQKRSLLIRTADQQLARIDLANAEPPNCGDAIEVIGFPETDLYRVNFTRASWRLTSPPPTTTVTGQRRAADQHRRQGPADGRGRRNGDSRRFSRAHHPLARHRAQLAERRQ